MRRGRTWRQAWFVACLAFGFTTPSAAQETYPSRPIRMVVPFPPGGGPTFVARLIADKLTEAVSQQTIVDHRPGGNTIIGSESVARAPADGYTLLATSSSHVTTPLLLSTPYDPIKSFTPVAIVASGELLLAVHPSVAARDLREFIALAKSKPGALTHGSVGVGSASHLGSEIFNRLAGIQVQNVPYKGGPPALTDLIGGQITHAFLTPANALPHIRSGKIRPLAISGSRRFAELPELPTFEEAGLPGLEARYWYGVFAPSGTPPAVVTTVSQALGRALRDDAVRATLASQGLDVFFAGPDAAAALVRTDLEKYRDVIRAANIKLEN